MQRWLPCRCAHLHTFEYICRKKIPGGGVTGSDDKYTNCPSCTTLHFHCPLKDVFSQSLLHVFLEKMLLEPCGNWIGRRPKCPWGRWCVLGKVVQGRFALGRSEKAFWKWGSWRIRGCPDREENPVWPCWLALPGSLIWKDNLGGIKMLHTKGHTSDLPVRIRSKKSFGEG